MKEYYEIITIDKDNMFNDTVEATFYSFEEAKENIYKYCSNDGYDHGPGTCKIYHVLEDNNGEKTIVEMWAYEDGVRGSYGDFRNPEISIEAAINKLYETGWLEKHDKELTEQCMEQNKKGFEYEYKRGYDDGIHMLIETKTSKAKKPVFRVIYGFEGEPKVTNELSCPNCLTPIVNAWSNLDYKPNYCHYCGQKFDWSEENK